MSRWLLLALLGGAILAGCTSSRAAGPQGPSTAVASSPQTEAPPAAPSASSAKPGTGPVQPRDGGAAQATPSRQGTAPEPTPTGASAPRPARRVDGPPAEGVEAFRAGKWQQAADAFDAALRRNPDDADAQFNLALTEERLGEADRARSAYQAALRLDPEHVPSLVNL